MNDVLSSHETGRLQCSGFELDLTQRCAYRNGKAVDLTEREWRIVEALAEQPGRTLSRDALAAALSVHAEQVSGNAIGVHLYNLRRKLGRHALETIRGRGYRLQY